ncbi:MAG TPA: hypothetical protein PL155_03175 [Candidatus Omnitrophota bacterium]|nr:hypothetical protein [Candidatus Omnitrophota bacterium]HPD84517.1 hypothetical protein [Candidatus Omnitrophota bacterium]HRZ03375.1 hypothetical protein [Candidatus Omnitrophota bacterium]
MRALLTPFRKFGLNKFLFCATIAVIAWYVLLCLAHYFSQRPLWNDEDCVFNSIKAFNAKDIFTRPLLSLQVFPRVYLFAIQQFSKPFDFHLLALRFFSLVFMLAAFLAWIKIARYEFKDKLHYLTFILSWSASAVLIYYSAELKQYSMDVLVGALFLLFLYHQERLQKECRFSVLALILVALPALIMVSYITFFFLLLPLYNLILSARQQKENRRLLLLIILYVSSAVIFGALSYCFDARLRPVAILTQEWRNHFISFDSPLAFFRSLWEGINNLFVRWFVERPKSLKKIGMFFVAFGFIYLFRGFFSNIKKEKYFLKSLNTVALVVFLELLIMGALKKYPFTVPRTSLFFCPVVLFLTLKGIVILEKLNPYVYRIIYALYAIYLIYLTISLGGITLAGKLTFRPIL